MFWLWSATKVLDKRWNTPRKARVIATWLSQHYTGHLHNKWRHNPQSSPLWPVCNCSLQFHTSCYWRSLLQSEEKQVTEINGEGEEKAKNTTFPFPFFNSFPSPPFSNSLHRQCTTDYYLLLSILSSIIWKQYVTLWFYLHTVDQFVAEAVKRNPVFWLVQKLWLLHASIIYFFYPNSAKFVAVLKYYQLQCTCKPVRTTKLGWQVFCLFDNYNWHYSSHW